MRKITVQPLTREGFAPFGQYYSMTEPEGHALCGELHCFYPDRLTGAAFHNVGYSPITVKKPEKMLITSVEYHTTTWEMVLPLDDDMILHVGPASAGVPVPEETKAFLVPAGTLVKVNAAVWHLCPLPANKEMLHAMIILPECTYANDCTVVQLKPEEQFELVRE